MGFTIILFLFHFFASFVFTIVYPLVLGSSAHVSWVIDTIPPTVQYFYYLSSLVLMLAVGCYSIPAVLLWKFSRAHMEDRRVVLEQLRKFSFDSAECAVESDREYVRDCAKR